MKIRSTASGILSKAQPTAQRGRVHATKILHTVDKRIGVIIVALHVFAIWSFGSVTAVDAASYIRLSEAWRSVAAFKNLNAGGGFWWYNYVPPGLPLFWLALSKLPTPFIWPALAALQHSLAAAAVIYSVKKLRNVIATPAFAIAAIFLCLLPFYMAFHNALTTESISSSIVIIGFALSVAITLGDRLDRRAILYLALLIFAAGLFRGTSTILLFGFAVTAMFCRRKLLSWPGFALLCAITVAMSWYPIARGAVTGTYMLNSTGLSALKFATDVNLNPSEKARAEFMALDWPKDSGAENIITQSEPVAFSEVSKLATALQKKGYSTADLLEKIEDGGAIIRHDNMETEFRAALMSSSTIGLFAECWANRQYITRRNMASHTACSLQHNAYDSFAWINFSKEQLDRVISRFFSRPSPPGLKIFAEAWQPYYVDGRRWVRDGVRVLDIPFSAFFVLYMLSAGLIFPKKPFFALALLAAPVGWFGLHVIIPFGGIRYAHSLTPLYFYAPAIAYALYFGRQIKTIAPSTPPQPSPRRS